jgi:DNA-binding MarR family transcriptional regulator
MRTRRAKTAAGTLAAHDVVDVKVAAWAKAMPEMDKPTFEAAIRLQRAVMLGGQVSIDRLVAPLALHPGDADVIANLFEQGEPFTLTPGRLTELCFVTSGATTGRLTRLKRAGLIRRNVSRSDRRSVNISLTRKGVQLAVALLRTLQRERFSVALARLGKQDVATLNRILRELERLLVADDGPVGQ